ncbi:LysE family transporter [Heyndrickxia acidicola]|uniref:LysE family transporter n=1 Tax=Heyndrickxia acidicola TaxID=209389 RepID=A0ABU6MMK5_9BACI|nr:LysE family transporter [Heyndrickxia acidicola]MED1204437.1 LysE family transporter [Heyndrickxia acidicola]
MHIIPFLLYVFVASFTPGPNNIMAMGLAHQFGFKKAFRFCIGVGIGFFVIMELCSYFNLLLKDFIPKIEFGMTLLGTVYMLYLAFKMLKNKSKANADTNFKSNFLAGVLLQFINPKAILYGLTTISTFIIPNYHSNVSLLIFSLLLAFIGLAATSLWGVCGSVFQKFLTQYRSQFNIVMALLLVYSAISIMFE